MLKKLNSLGFATHEQSCIEIGSNNGNLLKFLEPHFNEVLGVDPAENIAQIAINNGIKSIIQPGGSIKDNLSIDFCDKNSISMVITGNRHFKH